MRLANDAYRYRIVVDRTDGLGSALAHLWRTRIFRPPDLLAAYLTDPVTLDARWTIVLHLVGLLAIAAALRAAVIRLAPRSPAVLPLALAFLALHTATSLTCWLPANVGQTAAAACGLWTGLALWDGVEAARAGRPIGRPLARLWVLCLIGVNCKEIFYGWCLSGLLVWGAVLVRDRRPIAPLLWLAAPLVVVPLAHVVLRVTTGGLGEMLAPGDTRYTLHGPIVVLRNAGLALAGWLTVGPVHLARGLGGDALRLIPLAGLAAAAALVAVAWRQRPPACVAVIAFTLGGVLAALPSGHLSEVYLMGPNAGAALAVAMGLDALWRRHRTRAVAVGATLAAVGLLGLASRAAHFRVTWRHAEVLHAQVRAAQSALPEGATLALTAGPACRAGPTHSQYLMPPLAALHPGYAPWSLTVRAPTRPVMFFTRTPPPSMPTLHLDCADLPRHPPF